MSIEEVSPVLSLSPLPSEEVEENHSDLHVHIPEIHLDPLPPITTGRVITDFGKFLFTPENIPAIIATTSLTLIEMGVKFLSPFLLGKLVQSLTSKDSVTELAGWKMSRTALMAMFVGTSALSQVLPTVRSQVMAFLDANTLRAIVTKSMDHLLGKSLDYHAQTSFNEMFNLLQRGFGIQGFGFPLLTQIVPMLVETGIACVFLSKSYDMILGFSVIGLVATYVLYGIFTTGPILESRENVMKAYNEAFETLGKVLSRYKVMRDCNQLNRDLEEVAAALKKAREADITASTNSNLVSFGHSLMSYTHMLFAVLYAGQGVASGKYQAQDFIVLLGYLGRLASSLPSFGDAINRVLFSYPDLKFVFSELAKPDEVVDLHPDVPLLLSDEPPSIEFDNIAFCYSTRPEKALFQELSLAIPGGKKVAVVSESGFGKTTLFNLLYGYYTPAAGSVKIAGQDVTQVSLNSLQRQICLLGQNPNLFKGTIRENILYGAQNPEEITDDQIFALAESVGLGGFFDSFPEKLDTQVGEGGRSLSGGQQQKVSLLRSFMKESSVFLLDEATASLDLQSATQILERLFSPTRKATVLMITHKLTEAQMADEIIVLGEGKVLGQGTHAELLKDCILYQNLWNAFLTQQQSIA